MSSRQNLPSKLAKARQQLQNAQRRVAVLEAQLVADLPTPADPADSEERYHRTPDMIEATLLSSEMRFQSLVEAVEDYAIFLLDTRGHITSWNTGAERLKGYRSAEIIGQHFSCFFIAEAQQNDRPPQLLQLAAVAGRTEDEGWRVRKDGSRFWANSVITALRNPAGALAGFVKITRDLTQRKNAEENIRKLHRTLGVLSDVNQAIVRIRHLPALFEKACAIAVEKGAFRMAWIGLFDSKTGRLEPATAAGITANDLEKLIGTLDTSPMISALRAGERLICNDIQADPRWQSWRAAASCLGCRATVALPLLVAGEVRGVFHLCAGETDFFDEQEMRLMDEMAGDIAFAIEVAAQDEQRQEAEAAVKRYAARMEILHQIDRGIINANSIEAVVETALQHTRAFFACQQAFVGLFDDETNESVIFACDLNIPFEIGKGTRIPTRQGVFDEFGTGKVVVIDDLQQLPASQPAYASVKKAGLRSALRASLTFQGHPIGLLALNAAPAGFFTVEHQQIAAEIADQLAIAIHQMQLSAQLAQHTATLEQKVAERTVDLQAALGRVEAILNNSPDAILLVDADLTIQQTNQSFNTLFGATWNEDLGQSLRTLFHPDDIHTINNLPTIAPAQQNGNQLEVRAIRKDGTTFDAELNIGVIKDDGLVCIIRDITERKAQERQLRYHASIQENVSDAVIVTDMELRIQSWNEAAARTYGWTAAEAVGKVAPDFLQIRFPPATEHDSLMKRFNKEGFLQQETIQRRKDGTDIFILGSVTLLNDEKGVPVGVIAINHDITERKAYEHQLRYHASIQASVSDAVIATDMGFRIQSWNRAAELIYGWGAAEAIGQSVSELLQTIYQPAAERERIVRDFFERGTWQGEVIQHHRDGRLIHIQAAVNLFKDETGQPIGLVAVNRDITEPKRAAVALQQSAAEIHDLYNNAPCGYHSIDQDGLIVQINDTELRWLGYTREEVIGRLKVTALFTPESMLIFQRTFPLFIERGWMNDVQLDMVRKDGSIMHILLNVTAIYDDDGQYLKSRSTLFNITELQQTQRALVERETHYRLLAENISDVIGKTNAEGIRTFITPSCYALLGYTPDELIGQPSIDIIHPDDRLDTLAAVRQAVSDRKTTLSFIRRFRHKAGYDVWVEITNSIIYNQDTGQLLELIGVLRDVSERKLAEVELREAEHRYHALFEQAHDAVFWLDRQGNHIKSNHRAAEMLGYTIEELQTLSFRELSDEVPESKTVLAGLLAGETVPMFERVMRKQDGSRITVEINVELVRDLAGQPHHIQSVVRDITARKRAEESLRESEERFRRAILDAPFPIMIHADNGEVLHISNAWAEISGYTHAEIPTMAEWIEKAYRENSQTAKALIEKVYTLTKPRRGGEFQIWTKAGEERIWDFISAPLATLPDGRRMVSSMAMDVTERKRAEDALQSKMAEERQFQLYLKALHEIIIELTGIEQLEIFYQRAVELGRERLGFERLTMFLYDEQDDCAIGTYGTDVQGRLVDERAVRFTPDPHGIMHRSFERIERFYIEAETTLYHDEVAVGHGWNAAAALWNGTRNLGWFVADNLLHHGAASKPLLDIMGLYALSVGTLLAQKQTQLALKESEEKYRTLVETMRGGLAVFDPAFRVTFVNDRFCELLGYVSAEVIGKQPMNFVDAADLPLVQSHLERRQRAESTTYEIPIRHKDGHQIYVLMSGSPLLDKQGKYNGSIVVATDITIQKQAEAALRQALAKEKELGDLKTRFVSMASHEFRTPLATILAVVETLHIYRHKLSEAQIDKRFEKIKEQIGHLTDIMEDVLLLARMQARHVEFNPVQLDLDLFLRSILDEFQGQAECKHQLDYTVSEGIRALLLDRKLMRQIISNLVANAIKYSPAGTVVRIHLAYSDSEVALTVSDGGIGIPEADLPHLFAPFHRAANVGNISGTGLGLVITREAVELHGGTITVDSQEGVGTTFLIRIPVVVGGE